MTNVEWVEPALLWEKRKLESIKQPRLLQFQSDDFMPEFLAAMATKDLCAPPAAYLKDKVIDASKTIVKLYQPLHGCYYLVTASLICRQLGLPDKNVVRKNGEKTTFVIRRYNIVTNTAGKSYMQEEGWVNEGANKGWQPLMDTKGREVSVRADEERFPLHPVTVCGRAPADDFGRTSCCERTLYHGYLATGNREKYIQKFTAPSPAPADLLNKYLRDLKAATDALPPTALDKHYDFRLDEFDSRVIAAWQALRATANPEGLEVTSRYILLDMADNLERMLPQLWQALMKNDATLLNDRPQSEKLFRVLTASRLTSTLSMAQAMRALEPYIGLVRGEEIAPPDTPDTTVYNLLYFTPNDEAGNPTITPDQFVGIGATTITPTATHSRLADYVAKALREEPETMTPTEELASLLKDQVKLEAGETAAGKEGIFFLRLVYDYDPGCPPIVSQPSQPFRFAKFFEPDAPARHIRIELPSIKIGDMRKYKKGVGLQMSPELRDVMNRIHKGIAKGEPLLPSSGSGGLGMICSFSIQIIFLVAFIVMTIFLSLLDIVFWWMPFLKICLPIPTIQETNDG